MLKNLILRIVPIGGLVMAVGVFLYFVRPIAAAPISAAYTGAGCLVALNGSVSADFSTSDATALQQAIDAAQPGDLIKVASACIGVNEVDTRQQVANIPISLTIQGGYTAANWTTPDPLANPTFLDALNLGRGVYIQESANVTLSGLTINRGDARFQPTNDNGGGIFAGGNVTLTQMVIINNKADDGGGIHAIGDLHISESFIGLNVAEDDGGGIDNDGGTTTLIDSLVFGNLAYDDGGGIDSDAPLTLSNSEILSNSADVGGGIKTSYPLTVTESRIAGNLADSYGGGFAVSTDTVTIQSSIIVTNGAPIGAGLDNGFGYVMIENTEVISNLATDWGAGVSNFAGDIWLADSTVANNVSDGAGGGLYNEDGTVDLERSAVLSNTALEGGGFYNNGFSNITNTTFSNNTAGTGAGILNANGLNLIYSTVAFNNGTGLHQPSARRAIGVVEGTILANNSGGDCGVDVPFSSGYNVVSDLSCMLFQPTDLNATDPELLPLAANGGSTKSHAFPVTSAVVDYAPAGALSCGTKVIEDQRGEIRPKQFGCDPGAFELVYEPTAIHLSQTNLSQKTDMVLPMMLLVAATAAIFMNTRRRVTTGIRLIDQGMEIF